jgi:hypothetical protein
MILTAAEAHFQKNPTVKRPDVRNRRTIGKTVSLCSKQRKFAGTIRMAGGNPELITPY